MLVSEIAALCKKLRLSRNLAENAMRLEAGTHQEYLLRLLELEIERRENMRRDKLLKNAGFYTIKTFADYVFDEITLPSSINVDYLSLIHI